MRSDLQSVLNSIKHLPVDEIPALMGELEHVRAAAERVMLAPAPAAQSMDEQLDVEAAAKRMGVGKDYLYTHAPQLPFAYRQGRNWRFSANGIAEHIRKKTGSNSVLTARRH